MVYCFIALSLFDAPLYAGSIVEGTVHHLTFTVQVTCSLAEAKWCKNMGFNSLLNNSGLQCTKLFWVTVYWTIQSDSRMDHSEWQSYGPFRVTICIVCDYWLLGHSGCQSVGPFSLIVHLIVQINYMYFYGSDSKEIWLYHLDQEYYLCLYTL